MNTADRLFANFLAEWNDIKRLLIDDGWAVIDDDEGQNQGAALDRILEMEGLCPILRDLKSDDTICTVKTGEFSLVLLDLSDLNIGPLAFWKSAAEFLESAPKDLLQAR